MLRSLGLKQLASLMKLCDLHPDPKPIKKKKRNKEDSGSEYDAKEDPESEGDLSDDSLEHESEALQDNTPTSCTAKASGKVAKMAPGGRVRPQAAKRVVAHDVQTTRVTRSKKNLEASVVGTSSNVQGVQNHLACTTEEVYAANNECPNGSNGASNNMKCSGFEERILGEALIEWLGLRKKKGKTRPGSPVIAAKFATECNITVRNHVPIFPRWKDYKHKDNDYIFKNFREKVGSRFSTNITAAHYQNACQTMLKKGVRQQRHKLKKQYFDPFPLHQVQTKSPLSHMSDAQWEALVNSWKEQKKLEQCQGNKSNRSKVQFHQITGLRSYDIHIQTLGDNYKDEPPNALELFKECHYSKKRKAFTPTVQSVIDEIEHKIADLIEDGETPRNVTEVVSDVLVHKTKKNRFLCNVGIRNKPSTSNAMRRELEAKLAGEKQGSDELRALVDKQRLQMDAMAKEAESARAQNEEILKKQAETNEVLKRLMSMIRNFTST
ncbi:hypothetical protein U9M48_004109, partial [Paspalum notatum var. saurae]